jgi:hypothetical protein
MYTDFSVRVLLHIDLVVLLSLAPTAFEAPSSCNANEAIVALLQCAAAFMLTITLLMLQHIQQLLLYQHNR